MTTAAVMDAHSGWPYITAVSISGQVHRASAAAAFPGTTFRWHTSYGYSAVTARADEGITWICGWHDDDSEPVHAMLAARAMGLPKVLDLDEASIAFTKGKISFDVWKQNLDQWDVEFEAEAKAQQ